MNIIRTWTSFRRFPGGRFLFNKYLESLVPYTGSIRARVLELSPGCARVELRDRRAVRNHLASIHAVALMNLGEMASGLALNTNIPPDARAILVNYSITFSKKARGTLEASSTCERIVNADTKEVQVIAEIKDSEDDTVAKVLATWKVSPKK